MLYNNGIQAWINKKELRRNFSVCLPISTSGALFPSGTPHEKVAMAEVSLTLSVHTLPLYNLNNALFLSLMYCSILSVHLSIFFHTLPSYLTLTDSIHTFTIFHNELRFATLDSTTLALTSIPDL